MFSVSRYVQVAVLIVAATVLFVEPVAGQNPTQTDNSAFALVRSETRVEGELITRDGELFEFTSLDGDLIRISEEGLDYDLALAFALEGDAESGRVSNVKLAELEIRQHPSGGGEQIDFRVQDVPIEVGVSHYLPEGYELKITGLGSGKPGLGKAVNLARLSDEKPLAEKGVCCVTCGGVSVCGCAVSSNCGSCCSGACCGGGTGPFSQH